MAIWFIRKQGIVLLLYDGNTGEKRIVLIVNNNANNHIFVQKLFIPERNVNAVQVDISVKTVPI